ncbi:heterokaryon incompatibility protein-domain-containing protein [Cadophora sp. MPI-SDFR-AT-0126]|nr:heterokaryon incompatibility protein-domain-containing protein [Leotiomycetes sp. MPI-SDFR-AT-0126]
MSRELTWYWPEEGKVKQLIPLSQLPSQKDPSWIDFDILKGWMQKCNETHKHIPKRSHSFKVKRPRWLIDVRRQCLVSGLTPTMEYAALSYVWGQAECFKTLRSNLDAFQMEDAFNASKTEGVLPRTIRHAIHVAAILGIDGLWVDALCIVQDNDEEKSTQLHGMGAIYEGATVTFIAAVGEDSNFGIPGIHGISEPRDDRTRRKEDLVKDSEWYKRGWTFQELAFSQRRMIFTPNDVIWECSHTMWREYWGDPEYTGGRFPPMSSKWLTTWRDPGTDVLVQYGEMVEGFTKRKLTYSEDILDAFTGILVELSKRFRSRFICGLPMTFIDSALLWQPSLTGTCFSRRVRQKGGTMVLYLPSWSWAGWEGEIEYDLLKYGCYRGVYERHNGVRGCKCRTLQTCIFRYGTKEQTKVIGTWDPNFGYKLRSRNVSKGKKKKIQNHQSLTRFQTVPAGPKVSVLSPILQFRTSRRFFRVDNFDPAVKRHARALRICDDEGLTCGQLSRGVPEDLKVGDEKFEFIAISKSSNYCRSRESRGITVQNWMTEEHGYLYSVLLIERMDGVAYRKALGWITDKVWERGKPEMVTVLLG